MFKTDGLESFYRGFESLKLKASDDSKIIPFYIEILNKDEYMGNPKQWKITFEKLHQAMSKAYSLKYSEQ